jgi:hypothetical protein
VPYPAGYPRRPAEEPTAIAPVSRCLSATGIRFWNRPAPAGELGLPHGRLTTVCVDPIGVVTLRMSESRPGRTPSLPRRRRCRPGRSTSPNRRLPHPSGCLLTPLPHPIGGVPRHRASTRVHAVRPFGLPLHLWPPDGTGALGFDHLSSAPRSCPRRTSGWGQAIDTGLELHLRHQPNLLDVAHSFPCAFVSHGAPWVLGCQRPRPDSAPTIWILAANDCQSADYPR